MLIGKGIFGATVAAADVLTLSGQTRTAFRFNGVATLKYECEDDGNMYEQVNASLRVQIDTADDWVRPAASAPGAYETRFTGFSGDALTSSSELVNNWRAQTTSGFQWTLSRTTAGTWSNAFTIELRDGSSGGFDESGAYTMTATREDF